MSKRTISSIVLTVIIIAFLMINNQIVYTLGVLLMSLVAMHEYNKALKNAGKNVLPGIGYITCFLICLIDFNMSDEIKLLALKVFVPLTVIVLFVYTIISNMKYSFEELGLTILSIFYIPLLFSYIKSVLLMGNGRIVFSYLVVGAFASDVFAFLIGAKFGKRKLCEKISPKKTVEGAIAGVVGVVVLYIILTVIFNNFFNTSYNILIMALIGVVASIVGQFGDLAASTIKRKCDVKDFGSIMPGHGGMLDRCDSIMFVAPVIYVLFTLFII